MKANKGVVPFSTDIVPAFNSISYENNNFTIAWETASEIDFLKGWISQRLNWMDGQINNF